MKKMKSSVNILQHLFSSYLRLIARTVRLRWIEENRYGDSQIFGFWHEDSFYMNLVLKELSKRRIPIDVIVTADTRGDYIEYMVRECGGHALRVPDGYRAFSELKKIVQASYEKTHSIAVALDGPLGPRHEPKQLAFYLSGHADQEFVGITLSYSGCIRLWKRWDRYVIPLPFTTVTVAVKNYGVTDRKQIPDLPKNADRFVGKQMDAEESEEKNNGYEERIWKQITF